MEIALKTQATSSTVEQVRQTLMAALQNETTIAHARSAAYAQRCRAFEAKHARTTEDFLSAFEAGTLGDDADFFDWYAAKKGRDVWEAKARILGGVAI